MARDLNPSEVWVLLALASGMDEFEAVEAALAHRGNWRRGSLSEWFA